MRERRLTVVVPTRNRIGSLRLCLEALEAQLDRDLDQIVVADDGSTDGTAELQAEPPFLKVVRTAGGGSSVARNEGLRNADGSLILFVDDDIVCSPGMVDQHLQFHGANPDSLQSMVGLVTWDPRRPISRHMRWLEDGGPLFSFNTIEDFDSVDYRHFCTSNVSVKRALLDSVRGPFEERIRRFTDVELGSRLDAVGMRLSYNPDAVAWHLRSDTPASTDERMREVGKASVVLDAIAPDLGPPAAPRTPGRRIRALMARIVTPLTFAMPGAIADRVWSARAAWAYSTGRVEGKEGRS